MAAIEAESFKAGGFLRLSCEGVAGFFDLEAESTFKSVIVGS